MNFTPPLTTESPTTHVLCCPTSCSYRSVCGTDAACRLFHPCYRYCESSLLLCVTCSLVKCNTRIWSLRPVRCVRLCVVQHISFVCLLARTEVRASSLIWYPRRDVRVSSTKRRRSSRVSLRAASRMSLCAVTSRVSLRAAKVAYEFMRSDWMTLRGDRRPRPRAKKRASPQRRQTHTHS